MEQGEYYTKHGARVADQRLTDGQLRGRAAKSFSLGVPFRPVFCQGVKKDGSACRARPISGHSLCYFHTRQAEKVMEGDIN